MVFQMKRAKPFDTDANRPEAEHVCQTVEPAGAVYGSVYLLVTKD
jgi:hypothetical protein